MFLGEYPKVGTGVDHVLHHDIFGVLSKWAFRNASTREQKFSICWPPRGWEPMSGTMVSAPPSSAA